MNLKMLFATLVLLSVSIAHSSNENDINTESRKVKIYFSNTIVNGIESENKGLTLRIFDISKGDEEVLVLNSEIPEGNIEVTDKSDLIASMSFRNLSNNSSWQCNEKFSLEGQKNSYDILFKAQTAPLEKNEGKFHLLQTAKCHLDVKPHLNLIESREISQNIIIENPVKNNQISKNKEQELFKQKEEAYKSFSDLKNLIEKIQMKEGDLDEQKFKELFIATDQNPSTSLIRDCSMWLELTQYQTIELLNMLHKNPNMEYESFKKLLQNERNIAKVILTNPAFLVSPEILQNQENWQIQMFQRKIEEINYKLFTMGYISYKDEQGIKGKIIFKDPPEFNILEKKAISFLNNGEKIPQVFDKLNSKIKFSELSFLSEQRKMSYFNRFLSDFGGSIIVLGRQTREDFHNPEEVYTVDIESPADFVASAFDFGTAQYFLQNSIDVKRKFKFVLFERIELNWLFEKTLGTPHNPKQSVHEILKTYADCVENDGYIVILSGGGELPSEKEFIEIKNTLEALKEDKEAHIEGYDIISTSEEETLNNMKESTHSLNGDWDKVFPPKTEITWSPYVIFIKKSKN